MPSTFLGIISGIFGFVYDIITIFFVPKTIASDDEQLNCKMKNESNMDEQDKDSNMR